VTGAGPTLAVIGTGLIGSSLALALKSAGYCERVLGYSRTALTLERAIEADAVDDRLASIADAAGADVVILATPVGAIMAHLRELGDRELRSRLVMDVGSIKGPILNAATEAGAGRVFVGGHPMAGSEKTGPDSARADLFEGRMFFLVPCPETEENVLGEARELVKAAGAIPREITAQEHDRIVALTSHLPYLLAAALTALTDERSREFDAIKNALAGAFKGATRLADGSPEMWSDILSGNAGNIRKWLEEFSSRASELLAAGGKPDKLVHALEFIRESHRRLLD
jgi:prephenate dehydrogenase